MRANASQLVLIALCSSCVAPRADIIPRYGSFELEGSFGAADSSSGSSAAIESSLEALGVSDADETFAPRVDLKWIGFHLSLSALEARYSGSGTTEAAITIDGDTIGADVPVDTDLDLGVSNVVFTFDLFPGETFEIGLGLGVALLSLDLKLQEQASASSVQSDGQLPLPMLAGRFGADLGRFEAEADIGFIGGSTDEVDLQALDVDANAQYQVWGSGNRFAGFIVLGYRFFETDGEFDDGDSQVSLDFELAGPYLGLNFSF